MRFPDPTAVIVGINGTAAGQAAARLGAREAAARGIPLRIVHVFAPTGIRTQPDRAGDDGWAQVRHRAGAAVAEAVAIASRTARGIPVRGLVLDGTPVRELLRLSRSAELIVLGGGDLTRTNHLRIDSVLVQTVSRARCPVAVAHGIRPPAGPVLAAVDGSAIALLAVRVAAAEACRRGVPLEVVHVREPAGGERAARRLLESAVAAAGAHPVRSRLLTGDPGPTLVRASRQARMMIVGPRGAGGGALLGQVARRLLHRCACPTVFVHGTSAEEPSQAGTVRAAGAVLS
jgi:nucleotide-binding universal stress UspA family protein